MKCSRGVSIDHHTPISTGFASLWRRQYTRCCHYHNQLQRCFSRQTNFRPILSKWPVRHPTHATRAIYSSSYQSTSKPERSVQTEIKDELSLQDGEQSLPYGEKLSNAQRAGANRRKRGRLALVNQLSYVPAIDSQQNASIRQQSSRVETRRARKGRRVLARSVITSSTRKIFRKKRSLAVDCRRRYSPQIWKMVDRALPHWFAESDHIYNAILAKNSASPTVSSKGLLQFRKFVNSSPITGCQDGQIYQAWSAKSWRGKTVWWRHALYYALLYHPNDASRIVIDISKRPYLQVPGRVIADVLLLIQCRYMDSKTSIEPKEQQISRLYEIVCQYLQYYIKREGNATLPQSIIRCLSRALDNDRLDGLVAMINISKTEYTLHTKLHAMHRYLKLNNLNSALGLYLTLTKAELSGPAARTFYTTVLRVPWEVEDLYSLQQQLTTFMTEKGIYFNTIMRNVVLQNHLESGHRANAWQLLDQFRKAGLNTSEHTYSMFLKHTERDDQDTIRSLYHMAIEDGMLSRSVYLAGYFIQIAACRRLTAGENSFDAMLKLYRTMFNTVDLEDLGILEKSVQSPTLQSPSSFAVQWMLMSWLQENRRDPDKLTSVYNNYQFHLKNNHPRISLLASSTHLGTFFVLAFGHKASHLHMCTRVLQNMIDPAAAARSFTHETDIPDYEKFLEPEDPVEQEIPPVRLPKHVIEEDVVELHAEPDIPDFEEFLEPEDVTEQETLAASESQQNPNVGRRTVTPYKVAPPDEYTWNALLAVLLRHGRVDAAENALTAMQDAGVTPNHHTWNILPEGFATSQLPIDMNPPRDSDRDAQSMGESIEHEQESVVWKKPEANLGEADPASDGSYTNGYFTSRSQIEPDDSTTKPDQHSLAVKQGTRL